MFNVNGIGKQSISYAASNAWTAIACILSWKDEAHEFVIVLAYWTKKYLCKVHRLQFYMKSILSRFAVATYLRLCGFTGQQCFKLLLFYVSSVSVLTSPSSLVFLLTGWWENAFFALFSTLNIKYMLNASMRGIRSAFFLLYFLRLCLARHSRLFVSIIFVRTGKCIQRFVNLHHLPIGSCELHCTFSDCVAFRYKAHSSYF